MENKVDARYKKTADRLFDVIENVWDYITAVAKANPDKDAVLAVTAEIAKILRRAIEEPKLDE